MGYEATCQVNWAGEFGLAKVVLESGELIVRGGETLSPRSVPVASLAQIESDGEELRFHAGADAVSLSLGAKQAQSWARKLTTPPPTLASKLGIGESTRLALIGNFDAEELAAAIAQAESTESRHPDLILAVVKTRADLNFALDSYTAHVSHPPVWIVYPKGAGKPIGETEIRSTCRQIGLMDTKVASVSAELTALRFQPRPGFARSV